MRMQQLSSHIVKVMKELTKNQGLAQLIANDGAKPFDTPVTNPDGLLMNRIHPVPFDIEATTTDGTFLRVFYNQGTIGGEEIITQAEIHIDIICSRNLWLISDATGSLIRPYEIMDRVIDMLGKNSTNPYIRLEFEGFQHLYINTKFDCIRLYANYWEIET